MNFCTMIHAEWPDEPVTFEIKPWLDSKPYYVMAVAAPGQRGSLSLFLSPERLVELRDLLTAAIDAAAPALVCLCDPCAEANEPITAPNCPVHSTPARLEA